MGSSSLLRSAYCTRATSVVLNCAIFTFIALIVTKPCCESKPSAVVFSHSIVDNSNAAAVAAAAELAVADSLQVPSLLQSFDDTWRSCIGSAKPMARVQWGKMHGTWYADSSSDASDGITCAMTRYDKFVSKFDNGIVVTKLFTLTNSDGRGDGASLMDLGEEEEGSGVDQPRSVQTLEPAVAWLDFAADETTVDNNTHNGSVHAGSMTLIHALKDGTHQQSAEGAVQDADDSSGLLLRIYLIDTDYSNYAVFHTCAIFSETGHVLQTVHVATRSPYPFTPAQRSFVAKHANLSGLYGGSAADNYGQLPFSKQHCPAVARIIQKNRTTAATAVTGGKV